MSLSSGFKPHIVTLIGGGGHALSLLEAMPESMHPIGYTALNRSPKMSLPWLGDDQSFREKYSAEETEMICAFVYNGRPDLSLRRKIIESFQGYKFATLIASSAIVTPESQLGEGTQVLNRATINRAVIGRHCVINTGAIIEHDCKLDENVFIGPGAILGGEVKIGANAFIGLGAMVRNGISICNGAVIGMGAVVTSDVNQPGIYVAHGKHLIRL